MFHHQCTVLFVIIFLVFAVQCAPSPSRTEALRLGHSHPSPTPSSGSSTHCNFKCPDKDMAGFSLGSDSAGDKGRLHCTYPMSESSGARFRCEYHRHTGELLRDSNDSNCHERAEFSCPGTRNGKRVAKPDQVFSARSRDIPQIMKARAELARAKSDREP